MLHFKTLDRGLEILTKGCNLNMILPKHSANRHSASNLGARSLNQKVAHLINEYYNQDFSNFRYKKFVKRKGKLHKDITFS